MPLRMGHVSQHKFINLTFVLLDSVARVLSVLDIFFTSTSSNIKDFVGSGAYVNTINKSGISPLMAAGSKVCIKQISDYFTNYGGMHYKRLLELGADVNLCKCESL